MRRGRFFVLGAAILALNAAGLYWIHHDLTKLPKSRFRVLSVLPTGEADAADRLSLVMNDSMVGQDRVGQPLEKSPFAVHPAVAGHWEWSAPDKLEFLLDKRLAPGRRYFIRPTSDCETVTGRQLVGPAEFAFSTVPLRLLDCRVQSLDREHANLELQFNQPVHPDDLRRNLTVRDVERWHATGTAVPELEATCLTREAAPNIILRAARPATQKMQIVIDGRLAGHGAELSLGQDITRDLQVSTKFALLRAETSSNGLENIRVSLYFSYELDRMQKLPAVTVSPKVKDLAVTRSDSAILLEGQFECGRHYVATVDGNLQSADKQVLGEKASASFDIADRSPAVNFATERGVLSPQGNLMLDMEAVNVSEMRLTANRLHANNLVAHLRGENDEATMRGLKPSTHKLNLPRNQPQKVALDLRKVLAETSAGSPTSPLGVYSLTARYDSDRWSREHAIVTVTDLAITAKKQHDGYLVWVTSLRGGAGVGEVKVAAVSYNNQALATATTDADGLAVLNVSATHPDGHPYVITAEKLGDLSFIRPDEQPWVFDDVNTAGPAAPATYDVMLYTERGIYRPGETVHVTGIVRDAQGRIAPPMPLSLNIYRPDGKRQSELALAPDTTGQGVFHADFTPAEDAQTGLYRFTVTLPGAKEVLGQTEAFVEAFVPVRLEVKAQAAKPHYGPGESPQATVSGRYLFGSPAADLPVTVKCNYYREQFVSARYEDFAFDSSSADEAKKDTRQDVTAVLDANGQAAVELNTPGSTGLWRGWLSASVTEPGGRSVSANFAVMVDLMERHLGLRLPAGQILPIGQEASVDWARVDSDDKDAAGGQLEWSLDRVEWDWTAEQVDGRAVWKNQERLIAAGKGKIDSPDAAGAIKIKCPEGGRYRLKVTDKDSSTVATADFYATSGVEQGTLTSRPERVELSLDKAKYAPGTTARLVIRSPFTGKLLLSVETDRVLDRRIIPMTGKQLEVDLPVPADIRGGAFVAATIIRSVEPDQDKWMPHRAMGIVRLATDHSASKLPLTIEAPRKIEPGQKIQVTVRADKTLDAARPGMVHLWAVDEGILLTTSFRTPDPLAHFFAPRGLGVLTSDLYSTLLPDYKRPADMARIGGDCPDEPTRQLRRSPLPTKTRQSAIIWNKTLPLDADGKVEVAMDLPKFTGELRLMAVGVDHDRYGSAQQAMTVTAPLLVEAAWPRFAAPGDRFRVPVRLFNTSDQSLIARLVLKLDGPIEVVTDGPAAEMNGPYRQWVSARQTTTNQPAAAPATGPTSAPAAQPIVLWNDWADCPPVNLDAGQIAPGKSAIIWLDVTARNMGQVKASVTALASLSDKPLQAEDESLFTIRPVTPLTVQTKLLKLEAGKDQRIEPLGEFLAARTTVSVASMPNVQLRPAIEQLLNYPYGCVEQTTSKLYGILYAPDLLKADADNARRVELAKDMINAGIARLWSMQTRDGGLGYWPGDWKSNPWGTAYAASFLVRAKKAGYTIDKRFVDPLLDYIELSLKKTENAEADDNLRALLCNVLATFGRPSESWMNHLADRLDKLDIAGRANMASAWLETGRKDRAAAALPEDTVAMRVTSATGGRITSQASQYGVLLDTMLDMDRNHQWIPLLVARIEQARQAAGAWASTHDSAMCLSALARYQATTEQKPAKFEGTISVPGSPAVKFDHTKPASISFKDEGKGVDLTSTGSGTMYVVVTTEGLPKAGQFEQYDRQLVVHRSWADAQGRPINPAAMYVGQLVQVCVSIQTKGLDGQVSNIAIVDALPGGFEVENPRLATSAATSEAVLPDRVQFMDDRVVLFTSACYIPREYRYCLRVISKGSFDLPPIQASCMYDPQIACINGGGHVEVAADQPPKQAASRPTASQPAGHLAKTAKAPTTAAVFDKSSAEDSEAPAPNSGAAEELGEDDQAMLEIAPTEDEEQALEQAQEQQRIESSSSRHHKPRPRATKETDVSE